jgi:hypothetical protein
MTTSSLAHVAISTSFKSLSIFAIGSAACRLASQYSTEARPRRIAYGLLTLWLAIEAAVAVIAASVSSYRVLVLDCVTDR